MNALDFIRDVRNDLHRLAEIIAAAFLADHRLRRIWPVVKLLALRIFVADEALIVAEVEVGFRSVFRHEHFAVLKRAHRAGVDVDVGIELEKSDFEAARFEDRGEEAAAIPLPREDTTPPVTKTYLVIAWMLAEKRIIP